MEVVFMAADGSYRIGDLSQEDCDACLKLIKLLNRLQLKTVKYDEDEVERVWYSSGSRPRHYFMNRKPEDKNVSLELPTS